MRPLRVYWLLALASFMLNLPSGQCRAVSLPYASDITLLSRWIINLQYRNPQLPSYGAVKVHPTVAAISATGTGYYRVSPYFSNLGILGLLHTSAPDRVPTAQGWITWYFAHLNPQSAPDGVPYEHFYEAGGGGETTCVKPGDHFLCHYNDATDSAAATFFSVLWASLQAGLPPQFLRAPARKQQLETLATVLLRLQQPDGLCWAKSDYRAKYLEDNCEVYAGLRDLASLEQTALKDKARAQLYAQAAARVQQGIIKELYDPHTKLYIIAKFEDDKRSTTNLDVWFPDTQAQLWPHLFGVVTLNDSKTQAIISALNQHWNGHQQADWAATPELINNRNVEAATARAVLLTGDYSRVQTYLQAVRRLKYPHSPQDAGFAWPFTVTDAGWLLAALTQMQSQPFPP